MMSFMMLGWVLKSLMMALKMMFLFNLSLGIQIGFYRLVWHELRVIPGPPLAALSQLWILRETYLGRARFTLQHLGQTYGDWVRIGQ